MAGARLIFASVSLSVGCLAVFAIFAIFAVLFHTFLFGGSEETTGYLFKELVRDLLGAVANRLEGEGRHLSEWPGIRMSECDVGETRTRHCDWSAADWSQRKGRGAWLAERMACVEEGLDASVQMV